MSDRRDLQKELNRINELYQDYDLQMRKSGGTIDQRQKLRDLLNSKKERLVEEMGDDLQKLNLGKTINVGKGTISTGLSDTTKGLDAAKSPKGFSGVGKKSFVKTKSKMMPDIPGLSVGLDLLQGNTEEAADTVAEDVLQSAPSIIAKGIGKIAPTAAGLALKAANPLGMLIGEALGSEKAGEGSDKMLEDSQERDVELARGISEDDQLNQTRLRALQRMLGNK